MYYRYPIKLQYFELIKSFRGPHPLAKILEDNPNFCLLQYPYFRYCLRRMIYCYDCYKKIKTKAYANNVYELTDGRNQMFCRRCYDNRKAHESFQIIEKSPNYAISNHGNICNIYSHKFLKQQIDSKGFCRITLPIINSRFKTQKFYTHKLVVDRFYRDDKHNLSYVDHLDGDKKHNYIGNLVCLTRDQWYANYFT